MFLTFGTTPQQAGSMDLESDPLGPGRPRPKRAQVAQACDWCRVHRTKCDNERPCQNCVSRGAPCGKTGKTDVRSLPQAFREIQRLTSRVHDLELELARHNAGPAHSSETSAESSVKATPSVPLSACSTEVDHTAEPKRFWEGIYASTTQASPKQWYGPSSLFYFIGRIEAYMTRALQQHGTGGPIWFNPGTKSLPSLATGSQREAAAVRGPCPVNRDGGRPAGKGSASGAPGDYLNASQEEYFLDLFWQSHHCSLQIVDEATFREHYRSLCSDPPPGAFRRPSTLVDIVVALCMQYGVAFLPHREPAGGENSAGPDDGALAGWSYYHRCRIMLESEMERPTLSTLQTLVFAVIYLCCASFQNTAHHMLALTVRVGYTLGLHLEPPEEMPRSERELRKRLWWAVYVTEAKTCMKLGRPWSTAEALTTCSLPADDHELALQSGSNTARITAGGNTVTWLTYTLQNTKLVLAARTVYVSFFDRCSEIVNLASGASSLYDDPAALEAAADALECYMAGPSGLRTWLKELPAGAKTQRREKGTALSADQAPLDIELFAPAWLQRQRLFLELLYHTLMVNLHRLFIAFPGGGADVPSGDGNPLPTAAAGSLAMAHAGTAAQHSVAVTAILHQVVAETDLLKGWHEAFQQQWNAAITMAGFLLAFPASPIALDARRALALAIEVFEAFGRHFSVGGSAANAIRDLVSKIELICGAGASNKPQSFAQFLEMAAGQGMAGIGEQGDVSLSLGAPAATSLPGGIPHGPPMGSKDLQQAGFIPEMSDDEMAAAVRDMLAGTLDMVYSADSFLAVDGGMDPWQMGFC